MTLPHIGGPDLGGADAGRLPPGVERAPSAASGTTALLSPVGLRENAQRARRAVDGVDPLLADAWGHGADWVIGVLGGAGIPADALTSLSGVDLYGLPGAVDGARPVLRLSGRVLSTKRLLAGEGVSYGYLFRASEDTRVALVSGGYAQGIVRSLGGRADVVIGGSRCPIVGRVAMDVCVVDIRASDVQRGEVATYFGDPADGAPSLGEWTSVTAYSAAELVAAVGLNARRVSA